MVDSGFPTPRPDAVRQPPQSNPADETSFDRLDTLFATEGGKAMLEDLADTLRRREQWHAVFDTRIVQARLAAGLTDDVDPASLDSRQREALDAASRAAALEVGWPLLEAGRVAEGWMYLRVAAEPAEVAGRLAGIAAEKLSAADREYGGADCSEAEEEHERLLGELVEVALWEGLDPALGLRLVLEHHGTCNGITAFEQSIARLPPRQQEPAAATLVRHLADELSTNLAADLAERGVPLPSDRSIEQLLEAAGGLADDPAIHVDVSHLHNVLRIARVCSDASVLRLARELASYACRLPAELCFPGDGPFAEMPRASWLFFSGCLGEHLDEAAAVFRDQAGAGGSRGASGSGPGEQLAAEYLAVMLARGGREAEAVDVVLGLPTRGPEAAELPTTGLVPPIVSLAAAAEAKAPGSLAKLLDACRTRGDLVTYAQALTAGMTDGR